MPRIVTPWLWPTLKRIVERHTYTPTDVVGELMAPFW